MSQTFVCHVQIEFEVYKISDPERRKFLLSDEYCFKIDFKENSKVSKLLKVIPFAVLVTIYKIIIAARYLYWIQ